MLQSWRRPAKMSSDFNTLQSAAVTGMAVFAILLLFIANTRPHHRRRVPVALPQVRQPISMRGADREEAMLVVVTGDGRVTLEALSVKIADHLQVPGVEQRVYSNADARARWGAVKPVLEAVRALRVSCVSRSS